MKKALGILSVLLLSTALFAQGGNEGGGSVPSSGSNWPKEVVTIICPSVAGGGTDATIRAFSDTWGNAIGQNVVVTNYKATPVAMQACADAKPDGYTVVCHQNTAICQYVTGTLEINPIKDLALVAALQYMGEQALIVPANAPFNNFTEFVDYAKANPGKCSVAIATGGPAQFLWGTVMRDCGVQLKTVVAANTTDKLTNIAGGFIDCGQVDVANAESYEKAGKVKVIGVLSSTGKDLEGWPAHWHTLQVQGYNIGWDMRLYMWAPAKTDEATLKAMNSSLKAVMEDEGVKATLKKMGARAEWYDLEESRKILQNEYDSILATGKDLGIAASGR